MNPYVEYYEAIDEYNARQLKFDYADPYDHNLIDASIYDVKAQELRVKAAKINLGNVVVIKSNKSIMERIRRYFSDENKRATT
jgi:hypothetical protein